MLMVEIPVASLIGKLTEYFSLQNILVSLTVIRAEHHYFYLSFNMLKFRRVRKKGLFVVVLMFWIL